MPLSLTTAPTAEPIDLAEAKLHARVDGSDDDVLVASWITAARLYCETFTRRALVTQTWKLTLDGFASKIVLPHAPLQAVTSITYIDAAGATQTVTSTVYAVDTDAEPGIVRLGYGQTWPTTRGFANDVTVNYVAGYVTPFTTTFGTDVCAAVGHLLEDADIIRVHNSGGTTHALPDPLVVATDYHVRDKAAGTFKLAAAALGAAIDLTDDGVGTHYYGDRAIPAGILTALRLLVGHWYEHRESAVDGKPPATIPDGVEALLWQNRVLRIV